MCLYACDTDAFSRQLNKSECKLFSVVGGIRAVKNPLFLMKQFSGNQHSGKSEYPTLRKPEYSEN